MGDLALRPDNLTRMVRITLLVLVLALGLLGEQSPAPLAWWVLLVIAALPGLVVPQHTLLHRLGRIAETVVVGLAAVYLTDGWIAFLPYLAVPALAAGLLVSATEVAVLVAIGAAALVAGGWWSDLLRTVDYPLVALQWVALAAVAGGVGCWFRLVLLSRTTAAEPEYAQATRLLAQLRTIARQLPGTLDPGSIADRLLDELCQVAPAGRAAVFTGSGGGRLDVLAQRGPDRVAWETSLDVDTPISEAWVSQQAQVIGHSLDRGATAGEVSAMVLPLVTGVRTVGLVVLEADTSGAYPSGVAGAAAEIADHAALPLETALLFDEVRSLATAEERQRLAREIHDGIAQELVMVGYGIDNAIADLPDGAGSVADDLRALRAEVTRVITELRLSMFELRSDVDRHGGLASAIAEYARTVGASAGLRVHLSLDETTARLPAAVETELLRIAQEAVTNARKHANAANLWVSCEVDPPYARVEVSDDGRGIPEAAGEGRYGMSIMAERAGRVRAALEIRPRDPLGTTVNVVLGSRAGRGSVSQQQEVGPDSVQ